MPHTDDYARAPAPSSGVKSVLKRSAEWLADRAGPHRVGRRSGSLWVLMYHRILPSSDARFVAEEPGMVVTPESFADHLRALKSLFTVLPLGEWVERRQRGLPLPPRACAVTFDDGWLDNYEFALPVLEREQTPATIFAVSHMIGTRREFWPNRLARLLTSQPQGADHPALRWLAEFDPARTAPLDRDRISIIIDACKDLSDDAMNARLDEAESAMTQATPPPAAMLNWEQLRAMQASGLVDVGSHTCNHYRLVANLDLQLMAREIAASREFLQEQLGKPVTLFCYPNGDASPAAVNLVRQHYRAAVTTERGINAPDVDEFRLSRIGVHEESANTPTRFGARLSGWL